MMQALDRKKRLCIVPVCHGERFDLVHKFPSDNTRAGVWRKILDIPHLYELTIEQIRKRYFVCSRHFKISDYKNIESRGLNKTALPSKNLKSLNDYDTIDQTIMKMPTFEEVQEEVEMPTQFIKFEQLESRLLSGPMVPRHQINLDARKRKSQTVREYAGKRTSNQKLVQDIDDNFLDGNFKEFDGQLVFQINHVEEANESQDNKNMYILPVDHNQENSREAVEVVEPHYENFEEEETAVEAEETAIEDITNFVEIVQEKEEELHESNDMANEIADMFTHEESNKEDAITETLDIIHPGYDEPVKFHHFWLRDHCRCSLCYSAETFQRKFNIMDIPIDIKVRDCTTDGKDLTVEWSDGHTSIYDLDFLCRAKFENHRKRLIDSDPTVPWDKNVINEADYARVDFSDYLANNEVSKNVVRSLVKYGVAFIEKVPPNVQSTEIAIRNLFPIHRTFFGEMFTVLTDFKEFQDSAYTKEFLPAHTDNTYFPEASGLQILHVTQHNGTGGETLLVDGFKAATELKRKFPETFERLLFTNIPAEYLEEGQNHYDCSPLIKQNAITGELEQIRFNLYDRAPLHSIPHNYIMQYYKDFRLLANEIQSPQNEWWFKLNPGTVMIFNNWRVLHGRAQYTGKRSLCGSYVSRTDFMSKVRCLGILE